MELEDPKVETLSSRPLCVEPSAQPGGRKLGQIITRPCKGETL